MKIFSVGNSFSRNAHTFFNEIAENAGCELTLLNAYIGGCSLERHMQNADVFDCDRNAPQGSEYPLAKGCTFSLRQGLELKNWDIVTIQQASPLSFLPDSYSPHGDRLIAYIRKYAPKAEIVVHQTWAYRDDHTFWDRDGFNTDMMYAGLKHAYDAFANKHSLRQIPCGDAFQNARLSPLWGMPTPGTETTPAIRSLHNNNDKFHASDAGCYLLGCVWLETLFGKDARSLTYTPNTVPEVDATILREIAHLTSKD